MSEKILLIEDNLELATLLQNHLYREGYEIQHVADGALGLQTALNQQFELVICDVMLPSMNGLEVCERIREQRPEQLLLLLTSKDTELDMVTGLEMGADDYVVKPFNLSILLARVRALLRRAGGAPSADARVAPPLRDPLVFGPLAVDVDRRRVLLNNVEVELTAREFDIVALLATNPGRPYTREQLVRELWHDENAVYAHSVNALVSKIRAKIETDPLNPVYLKTVRGHGYRFIDLTEL